MARRKKPKTVTGKIKKDEDKPECEQSASTDISETDTIEFKRNDSVSELGLCVDESDLVVTKNILNAEEIGNKEVITTYNAGSILSSGDSDCVTHTVVVELAEDFSPVKPKGDVAALRSSSEPERCSFPNIDHSGKPDALISQGTKNLRNERVRNDSESSDEYEYSAEATEPINIEEMIGGLGPSTDSAYLLYDSVLNSALRSSDVGCIGESLDKHDSTEQQRGDKSPECSTNDASNDRFVEDSSCSQISETVQENREILPTKIYQDPSSRPSSAAVDVILESEFAESSSKIDSCLTPALVKESDDSCQSGTVSKDHGGVPILSKAPSSSQMEIEENDSSAQNEERGNRKFEDRSTSIGERIEILDNTFKHVVKVEGCAHANVKEPSSLAVESEHWLSTSASNVETSSTPEVCDGISSVNERTSTRNEIVIEHTAAQMEINELATDKNEKYKEPAQDLSSYTCEDKKPRFSRAKRSVGKLFKGTGDLDEKTGDKISKERVAENENLAQNLCSAVSQLKVEDESSASQRLIVDDSAQCPILQEEITKDLDKVCHVGASSVQIVAPMIVAPDESEINKGAYTEFDKDRGLIQQGKKKEKLIDSDISEVRVNDTTPAVSELDTTSKVISSSVESEALSTKSIGSLRPRRQTRQPKRIADEESRPVSRTAQNNKQPALKSVANPVTELSATHQTSTFTSSPLRLQNESPKSTAIPSSPSNNCPSATPKEQPDSPSKSTAKGVSSASKLITPASPSETSSNLKSITSSPSGLKSSSPIRTSSPQPSKASKLPLTKLSQKKNTSSVSVHDPSPKLTTVTKSQTALKSPKNVPPPKPPATKAAVKAYPKNLSPPKMSVPSKGALKAMAPKTVNKSPTPKAATPKTSKGALKAAGKSNVVKEETDKLINTTAQEPIDVDQECVPKMEVSLNENSDLNGGVPCGISSNCDSSKVKKVEIKKEAALKKPEGTRRRSNRIRVNRWDEGPAILAASLASINDTTTNTTATTPTPSPLGSNLSPSSNLALAQNSPSKEAELPPPLLPASFEIDKPVKVKSRWRRTSELEMGSGTGSVATSLATPQIHMMTSEGSLPSPAAMLPPPLSPTPPLPPSAGPEVEPPPPPPPPPPPSDPPAKPLPAYETDHPEIEERLKSFEIIKENVYLTARQINKENKRMVCECTLTEEDIARGEPGCGEHCLNRLLMIECSHRCTLGNLCSNKRFQNCEYSKCSVVRTQKKGLGLISTASIPGGEFLMEYVGEVLDPKEFRRRAKDYAKEKTRHYYFMELKSGAIIDATVKGNISRFINHSCDPNAETQKWTVNGELRIGFFSKRSIAKDEEVTFDYKLQRYGKEAQRCHCGSANCRIWIGEDPEKEDKEEKDKNWSKVKDKKEKKKTHEELEEEIEKLRLSGIKNRAHTLMLNRLMVRAEDHSSRSQLLSITQSGVDQRCLRLFLDYHGLNLLWSWMVDSTAPTSLKIQILDTFSVLPITNKTILQDSKVLGVVERWAKKGVTPPKQKPGGDEESSSPDSEETGDGSAVAKTEDKVEELDPDDAERQTVVAKAVALYQTWETLKEEFRIPKKERIEQMKEHEREADRGYVDHEKAMKSETSYDRHWNYDKDGSRLKRRGRESPDSMDWKSRSGRGEDRNGALSSGPQLTKVQRRQLFEMKVEEEERQKRLEEERWANHQEQCYALGVDPNMTYPPQHNGFYHPLGTKEPSKNQYKKRKSRNSSTAYAPEMPADMYGPGGMGHPPMPPQRYPPPPSPFMPPGGPPLSPAFPPPFHQMGLAPPPPPSQGMVPPRMGVPMGAPPGMHPALGPNVMVPPVGPSPFGPPHGIPQFPPNGMPPPGPMPGGPLPGAMPPFSNPPLSTNPQSGYPPPPFLTGAPPSLEPPNDVMNVNSVATLAANVPAVIMIKLPKNWKITIDKERKTSYYYHSKTRHVQWTFPSAQEVAEEEAKCASMKASSKSHNAEDSDDTEEEEEESESEEEDSTSDEYEEKEEEDEDDLYDDSIMSEARRKAREELMIQTVVTEPRLLNSSETDATIPSETGTVIPTPESYEPALKKKRDGLVTVNIISPRDEDEDYRKGIKKSKIKETKMKLARQKARAKAKAASLGSGKGKSKKAKTCEADTSSGPSRKIKDKFRVQMANVIVTILNPYRKADCKVGRIMNTEDFKHLARKLTHFVMVKELRHVAAIEDLQCNDNVKHKARDFIRKYMSKFGAVYSRSPDD